MMGANLLLNTQTTQSGDDRGAGDGGVQEHANKGCGFFDKKHQGRGSRWILRFIWKLADCIPLSSEARVVGSIEPLCVWC
jgi:hypothetical protein